MTHEAQYIERVQVISKNGRRYHFKLFDCNGIRRITRPSGASEGKDSHDWKGDKSQSPDQPPVKEPPAQPKKPPVKEPEEPPGPPPPRRNPPVKEPPDEPRNPPVKEPPPKDPDREPPKKPPIRAVREMSDFKSKF